MPVFILAGLLCWATFPAAASRPGTGQPLDHLEYRGFTRIGGEYSFSIHNKSEGRGEWFRLNVPHNGYEILKFDPRTYEVTIRHGRQTVTIPLQSSNILHHTPSRPENPPPMPPPASREGNPPPVPERRLPLTPNLPAPSVGSAAPPAAGTPRGDRAVPGGWSGRPSPSPAPGTPPADPSPPADGGTTPPESPGSPPPEDDGSSWGAPGPPPPPPPTPVPSYDPGE